MLMCAEAVHDPASGGTPRRAWPYRISTVVVVLGALGLVIAPFGAAVYLALPGVALGTWFAFLDNSPFRIMFALSLSAFVIGLATGLIALYVAASPDFLSQELGFLIGAGALWALPLLGLILGAIALLGAHFRPGVPDSAVCQGDFEPV